MKKHSLWVLVVAGCASSILAPEYTRQSEFLQKTTLKSGTVFTKAVHWFDKNLKYNSGASRMEDTDSHKIKMDAGYLCNVFRKPSDLRDYYVAFHLVFESVPGAMDLHFTSLRMEDAEGNLVSRAEAQLSNSQNIDNIRPCLKKMVASLVKAVESTDLTW